MPSVGCNTVLSHGQRDLLAKEHLGHCARHHRIVEGRREEAIRAALLDRRWLHIEYCYDLVPEGDAMVCYTVCHTIPEHQKRERISFIVTDEALVMRGRHGGCDAWLTSMA